MVVGWPKIDGAVFTVDTWPLVKLKLKACTAAEPRLGTITRPSVEAEYVLLQASSAARPSRTSTASTQVHLLDILRFISMFSCGQSVFALVSNFPDFSTPQAGRRVLAL